MVRCNIQNHYSKIVLILFCAVILLPFLSSCEGHKIRRQIAETNNELPIRLYDGITVTSVSYGDGVQGSSRKAIVINLHVEDGYISSFNKIRANCSSEDFRELKTNTLIDLRFNQSLKKLIELASERGYVIVLRFHYKSTSQWDIGFWDLE